EIVSPSKTPELPKPERAIEVDALLRRRGRPRQRARGFAPDAAPRPHEDAIPDSAQSCDSF
ncbi:MAG TPA: hypothetical protein VI076_03805, partial [Actinopolymorphaceae bacterium]